MKRISPEQVVAAYKERGWRPVQEEFAEVQSGFNCACGLGVMAGLTESQLSAKRSSMGVLTLHEVIQHELSLGTFYVDGYTVGFDGGDVSRDATEEERTGYEDGRGAWEAVVAAGLVE